MISVSYHWFNLFQYIYLYLLLIVIVFLILNFSIYFIKYFFMSLIIHGLFSSYVWLWAFLIHHLFINGTNSVCHDFSFLMLMHIIQQTFRNWVNLIFDSMSFMHGYLFHCLLSLSSGLLEELSLWSQRFAFPSLHQPDLLFSLRCCNQFRSLSPKLYIIMVIIIIP